MGYAFAGTCHETAGDALVAFNKSFPVWGDVNVTALSSSSVTGGGLLSYSVLTRPISTNVVASRTGTLQLSACSDVDAISATASFLDGMTLGWGIVFAMVVAWGFRQMKREAK
jgi:hypothetical protein